MTYFEERRSESPYVDAIMRGTITEPAQLIRPAEIYWHLVFIRTSVFERAILVGPWTSAGIATFDGVADVLWIRFKLGAFMPHQPVRTFLDRETVLPSASRGRFALDGELWQLPDYENADTFVARLHRRGALGHDPLVDDVLQEQPNTLASRTVRHRFLQATGLTQRHILQVARAQRAADLLRQGASIPDTMFDLDYFDQPHLTRSLRQLVGHTPAQLLRMGASG
jgi:hypothetical protein